MTNELAKRIRRACGILLSISIAVAGICLICACVGIYRTGDHPFSREVVALAFSRIAFPVYLCLGLVILGFVLDLILPGEKARLSAGKQTAQVLKRLHSKVDLSQCDEALRSGIAAQQKSRRLHRAITAVLLAIGSLIFLLYAGDGSRFHQSQINDSMIRAMKVLLPCMAVPFGYAVFTTYHSAASIEKEIALLKQAGPGKRAPSPAPAAKADRKKLVRNTLLVVAVVSLVLGFLAGGSADVLTKAVNICTECVGLG